MYKKLNLIALSIITLVNAPFLNSFPCSHKQLIKSDKHIDLLGDMHLPLTEITNSEAELLVRLKNKKSSVIIWEYNDQQKILRNVLNKLAELSKTDAGTLFILDTPQSLNLETHFKASDCRPLALNLLITFESCAAAKKTYQKQLDKTYGKMPKWYSPYSALKSIKNKAIDNLYKPYFECVGFHDPKDVKPEIELFFGYIEKLDEKIEKIKETISESDYSTLKESLTDLREKRDRLQKDFDKNNELFFEIFSEGLLTNKTKNIEPYGLDLLNFILFDVVNLNFIIEFFATDKPVLLYAGQWHINAIEILLIEKFGFIKQQESLGVGSFLKKTYLSNDLDYSVSELSSDVWNHLI